MAFITVGKKNDVAYLSAYFTARADGRAAVDLCAHFQRRTFTKCQGPPNDAAFHYFRVTSDIDGACCGIDYGSRLYRCTLFNKKILTFYYDIFRYRGRDPAIG